jgi:hypothetical protein
MKAFKITSKLTPAQSQRLRRAAQYYYDKFTSSYEPLPQGAFRRVGRNLYTALDETVNIHQVAQHAMTVAGRTFDYDIVNEVWEKFRLQNNGGLKWTQ